MSCHQNQDFWKLIEFQTLTMAKQRDGNGLWVGTTRRWGRDSGATKNPTLTVSWFMKHLRERSAKWGNHGFALEGHGIWRPRVTAGELRNRGRKRGACAQWLLSLAENPFWTKPWPIKIEPKLGKQCLNCQKFPHHILQPAQPLGAANIQKKQKDGESWGWGSQIKT